MAVVAQTDARIYIGSFEWTSFTNQAEVGFDVATQDVTTFGSSFTQYVPGLKTMTFNVAGFNDYAGASLDEWTRANVGTRRVCTIANATPATGGAAYVGYGQFDAKRMMNAAVGAVPTVTAQVGDGYTAEGLLTQISTSTVTATGNSTPQQVGAVASGRTILAAIHVLSVTGTTPSLTCQLASSTTLGGAYTARGSAGAAITAAGDQLITIAAPFTGSTDGFWRINYTVSGTTPVFTVVATIAITGP